MASWLLGNDLGFVLVTVPGPLFLLALEPALALELLLEFSPLLERVLPLELLLLPGLLLLFASVLLGPLLLLEPVPVPGLLLGFVSVADIDILGGVLVRSGHNLARYCVDPAHPRCFV